MEKGFDQQMTFNNKMLVFTIGTRANELERREKRKNIPKVLDMF